MAKKYMDVLKGMYDNNVTAVKCAAGMTQDFKVEMGLHQRSTPNPFLFSG